MIPLRVADAKCPLRAGNRTFALTTDGPDEFIEIFLVVVYRHLFPLAYRFDRMDEDAAIAYFGLRVWIA